MHDHPRRFAANFWNHHRSAVPFGARAT
jgi:hypothetical protein